MGVIYSRQDESIDERRIYSLDDLQDILSVVKDFIFLLQEKWRIAVDRPGSGNTKKRQMVAFISVIVEIGLEKT